MKKIRVFTFLLFTTIIFIVKPLAADNQSIDSDLPHDVDDHAKYIFYLHGKIIEDKGIRPFSEKYGFYEYEEILKTLKEKGFTVISEKRKKNTNGALYAEKVVDQVKLLLKNGIPARKITIVGASKGAIIGMMACSMLKNRELNFVFLAGCNDYIFERYPFDFYGNILSIYDMQDEIAGSCKRFYENSHGVDEYKEVRLEMGLGHGLLYKPYKSWVDLVVGWANR